MLARREALATNTLIRLHRATAPGGPRFCSALTGHAHGRKGPALLRVLQHLLYLLLLANLCGGHNKKTPTHTSGCEQRLWRAAVIAWVVMPLDRALPDMNPAQSLGYHDACC